jgi:TonB-linked SusC/RagA family outer membrane protein
MKKKFILQYTLTKTIFFLYCFSFSGFAYGQSVASLHHQPDAYLNQQSQIYTLREVLQEIKNQYGVNFICKGDLLDNKTVNALTKKEKKLETVLKSILEPLGLNFSKMDNKIYLIFPKGTNTIDDGSKHEGTAPEGKLNEAHSNERFQTLAGTKVNQDVSGKVVDENDQPLVGVNILVKGTTIGTTSSSDGSFAISVPEGSTLVFSFIGYLVEEIVVGNRSIIQVQLMPDIQALQQVVVIGYGTQERKDVSSAIGSVKGADLKAMAVTGADQAMQGKIAGVNITSNDGTPGGSTKVTVRGIGSINNTEPLYVIDGVMSRQGLTNIVATDIESIDVLKDASATAIYGIQGANGVVIVTTKRGKGGSSKLTFDAYYGVSNLHRKLDLLSSEQFVAFSNEAIGNANSYRALTGNRAPIPLNPAWSNPQDFRNVPTTDWQKEVFRPAAMQDYQLGFSGGKDKTTYAASLGYRNQEGMITSTSFKRYNLRVNIDHKATDFLKLGTSLSNTFSTTHGVFNNNLGGGMVMYTLLQTPLLPVRQPGYEEYYAVNPSGVRVPNAEFYYPNAPNPLDYADRQTRKNTSSNFYGSLYGELTLPFDFSFRSQIGVYKYDGSVYNFTRRIKSPWDPAASSSGNGGGNNNYLGYGYNWDNTLSYSKELGDHNISVTAGAVAQMEYNEGFGITQSNFTSEEVPYIGYGDPTQVSIGSTRISKVTLFGLLGRVIYGYKNRYLFTANIRRDQSSRFAPDLNTGIFPSASVAWRVSEEDFMKLIPVLSDMKIRLGWGKIGSQNGIPAYPTYTLLGTGQDYVLGGNLVSGVATTSLGNAAITWEKTESKNIGLDLALFNNAFTFTADYYVKDNSDILLQLPIVATGGVGFYPTDVPGPAQNVGKIRNSGLELTATYSRSIKEFTFSVSGNGTFNKNEILSLGGPEYLLPPNQINQIGDYVSRFGVGQPIGSFYGYVIDGIFQTQAEVEAANRAAKESPLNRDYYQQQFTAPGDFKFRDINGDKVVDEKDRTYIGNPNPKFSYGFSLSGNFKGFDASLFFQGVQGVDVYNAMGFRLESPGGGNFNRTRRVYEGAWRGEGSTNEFPRLNYDDPNNNNRISTRWVENGSYLRLRNLQLGYSLPKTISQAVKMEKLRVYVAGQNVFTKTKYSGLDPEAGVGQSEGDPNTNYDLNIDRGLYPQPRTFMVGVNVTF